MTPMATFFSTAERRLIIEQLAEAFAEIWHRSTKRCEESRYGFAVLFDSSLTAPYVVSNSEESLQREMAKHSADADVSPDDLRWNPNNWTITANLNPLDAVMCSIWSAYEKADSDTYTDYWHTVWKCYVAGLRACNDNNVFGPRSRRDNFILILGFTDGSDDEFQSMYQATSDLNPTESFAPFKKWWKTFQS